MIVEATITAAEQWTATITPDFRDLQDRGSLNVSVSDNDAPTGWVANISLQRAFPPNNVPATTVWHDVLVFTSDSQQTLVEIEEGVRYRIGCDVGDWTSGEINVRLSY